MYLKQIIEGAEATASASLKHGVSTRTSSSLPVPEGSPVSSPVGFFNPFLPGAGVASFEVLSFFAIILTTADW